MFGRESGIGESSTQQIRDTIDYLTFVGAICIKGEQYPVLGLTQKAKPILFNNEEVWMPIYTKKEPKKKKTPIITPSDPDLFEKLRQCRLTCAKQKGYRIYYLTCY